MRLRPGVPSDAPALASLHASEISEGFLPTLGPAFLRRLYRRFCLHPASFVVVAEEESSGEIVGFGAGAEDLGRVYRTFLVRDGVVAGVAAAPQLVRRWRKVLETLRYPSATSDLPKAEVLSVAVAPAARGQGVGRALLDALVAELSRRGVPGARVVCATSNVPAVALYESAGFKEAERLEVHAGTTSTVLTWP
jgi:ribosomal protein S18 acetylase RimI-like enzyme